MLENITRFDQKVIIHCVLLSHDYCLQKYTTHQFTYFIYHSFQENYKNPKNYKNPTSSSEVTYKTIFIVLFKLFSIGDSFEFNATREMRLI